MYRYNGIFPTIANTRMMMSICRFLPVQYADPSVYMAIPHRYDTGKRRLLLYVRTERVFELDPVRLDKNFPHERSGVLSADYGKASTNVLYVLVRS